MSLYKDLELRKQSFAEELNQQMVTPEMVYNAMPDPSLTASEQSKFRQWAAVFTGEKSKRRSEEFLAVKNALDEMQRFSLWGEDLLAQQISSGRITEKYESYMRLYEALTAYVTTHIRARSEKGKQRFAAALHMRHTLDLAAKSAVGKGKAENEPEIAASKEEIAFAEEHVGMLIRIYQKYSIRIDGDLLATNTEKLVAKWNVMRTSERNIHIFIQQHRTGKVQREAVWFAEEYRSLRSQIRLLEHRRENGLNTETVNKRGLLVKDHAHKMQKQGLSEGYLEYRRQTEEEKDLLKRDDAGLTRAQMQGLEQIDHWVLQNIRNGGYMTLGLNVSDRTDFTTKLLSMSKRERLYCYYLVETKERLNPTPEGIYKSQTEYIPSLSKFKSRMKAMGVKFYSRFSGGYVYWGKLSQAMGLVNEAKAPIAFMEWSADLVEECRDQKSGEIDRKQLEQEVKQYAEVLKDALEKKKAGKTLKKVDFTTYGLQFPRHFKGLLGLPEAVSNDFTGVGMENGILQSFIKYAGRAGAGMIVPVSLVGLFMSVMDLAEDKTKRGIHIAESVAGMVGSAGIVIRSVNALVKAGGVTNNVTKALSSTPASFVFSGVGVVNGVIKSSSWLTNGHERKKASRLVRERNGGTEGARFEQGMLRLNRKLGVKQRVDAGSSLLTSGASLVATILVATSVCSMGLSALVGGIAFGAGIAATFLANRYKGGMKDKIFDTFFDLKNVFAQAEADYLSEHGPASLTKKKKATLKEQVRRRMAAELGYNSPRHAASAVMKVYAKEILRHALVDADPMQEECIAMVRGLGCAWKPEKEPPVPGETDLVKKLMG